MSNTCKNCKYRETGDSNTWRNKGVMKPCNHNSMISTYHDIGEDTEDHGIVTEDDEGWGFLVAPNFGCINFEPKD